MYFIPYTRALHAVFAKSRNFIVLHVTPNFVSRYVRLYKLCSNFEDKFRVKFANIVVVSQQQH